MKNGEPSVLDFNNTEVAFSSKTDKELKKMSWIFGLMNKKILVRIGSKLALFAAELNVSFIDKIIRWIIFDHFCGGEDLLECQSSIEQLYKYGTLTVLDYSAEGKSQEEDLEYTRDQIVKTIEFAAAHDCVPVVSMKLTGLIDNTLLEKVQEGGALTEKETIERDKFYERVNEICSKGHKHNIGIFIDAEETWMQDAIDELVIRMMETYNHQKAVVYNTYQMYRVGMLDNLVSDFEKAKKKGYIFGAKLVRGAYMDKERERADTMGYDSPIQPTKSDTDQAYDDAIRFCVEHYEEMASCNATHNLRSNELQAKLIADKGIVKNHDHLNFSQLYGMSDYITFNLAAEGYNVAKYLPYGPVKEVMPYLIRRAEENSAVTGEMGRELLYLNKELKRRGLKF